MLSSQNKFILKILLWSIVFFTACDSTIPKKDLSKTNFLYISNKKFKLKDQNFFPVMLNYVPTFRIVNNEVVVSPIREYEDPNKFETNTKDSILHQLKGHLQLINEMGFNSIRVCFNRISGENNNFFYKTDKDNLYINKDSSKIINAIVDFIKIAESCNLRVMILISAPVEKNIEEFTISLLNKFKDNPVIFAYDFFNEPLYFDNQNKPGDKQLRSKKDAYNIVYAWKKIMSEHAPYQLLTIGFSEPLEVFEWDPSILPVDFIAFHTYHPLRVPNEIYWYSNYVNKPWMIGETALPADNDSITYAEQRQFLKEVYNRIIDCGGAGLGWWEFQEIPNTHFEAQYSGILNHVGKTTTKDGKFTILGTVKPVVKEISKFKEKKTKNDCDCMVNYFNMVGYSNIMLKGKIINTENGQPIEGAVIRGWNKWWNIGLNTYSNKNGEFMLYSNDFCVHFEISSPGMTKVKFDYTAAYLPNVLATINHNFLPNQTLEYHSISYKPFLLNNNLPDTNSNTPYIFNFNELKFNNYILHGEMKTIELSPLDL